MASNKFDTSFKKEEIKDLTLTYTGLYGDQVKVEGDLKQILGFLITKI